MVQTTPKATSSYARSEPSSLMRSVRVDHAAVLHALVCVSYSRDGPDAYFHYEAIVSGLTKVQQMACRVFSTSFDLRGEPIVRVRVSGPLGLFVEAMRRFVDGLAAALQVHVDP